MIISNYECGVTDFVMVSEGDDDKEVLEFDDVVITCFLWSSFLLCWILVVVTVSGMTQLHKIPALHCIDFI